MNVRESIVVTGAGGFLGRHTAKHLSEQGYLVIGIGHGDLTESEWKSWGLSEWHREDLTFETLQLFAGQPSAIIHCAGSGSVPLSLKRPWSDFQRTVATIANVLEYIRAYSPSTKLVYPSSASVYGNATSFPISEDSQLAPISPYGVHKLMAEQLIKSYSTTFGLETAMVRFFSIYGEGLRKQLLWDACGKLSRGELDFMGTGEELRDWLHVSDAASLLSVAILHANQGCPVVNGGAGEGVSVKDIVSQIAQSLQPRAEPPRFSGTSRQGDPIRFVADTTKVTNWGWSPTMPWRENIAQYARWWSREKERS